MVNNKFFLVHYLLPFALSTIALVASLVGVYDFQPNVGDYGLYTNVLWNFAHGNGWLMSFNEGFRPTNFLADHFDLMIPLFSFPFLFTSSAYTYACMHAASFAALFFLAPVFVREIYAQYGRKDYLDAALFLLLALCLFPGVIGAWRYQSHTTTLVMPLLLLALLFLHRRQTFLCVLCCLLVALAQERAIVALFGVGMYAILITKNIRLGLALCVVSTCVFFAVVKVVIPYFAEGDYYYTGNINPYVDWDKKLYFLVKCIAGWFCLLLVGKRAMYASLCAMPLLAIALVSSRSGMYTFSHQYQDLPSIFLFAGATFGLLRLSESALYKKVSGKVLALLAVACFSVSVACFYWFNPIYLLLSRHNLDAIHSVNNTLAKYADLPETISTYTSTGIGTRFATREKTYMLAPQNASGKFLSSMVLIAPALNMYPYGPRETAEILEQLQNNDSLEAVHQDAYIHIFASKDIVENAGK